MPLTRAFRTTVVLAFILSLSPPWNRWARCDDPCEDAHGAAAQIARALSASLAGPARGGKFVVAETVGTSGPLSGAPVSYEITYVVGGKVQAKYKVDRDVTDLLGGWPGGYPEFQAVSGGSTLDLRWHSGGSGCCECKAKMVAGSRGFLVATGE